MALQLKKFSYKALKGMTVQDRLAAAQDREMGQWLMSLLTPSQFVDLFPDYYRKRMPDIGGFMAAMPTSMSRAKQEAIEEQLGNTVSGDRAGSNYKAGGWKKKYQDGVDKERATVSRAGTKPPPQLSPEQQQVFNELTKSPIAADDPRAKFFANLSDDQLTQAGISKTKDKDGKEVFQYRAPTVTEEQQKEYIRNSSSADKLTVDLIKRKESFISTAAWDVNHYRAGYGSDTITLADGTVQEIRPGMRVTREDADRDLARRIPEFQKNGIIRYVGQTNWDKLGPETKAALTSLAYNYGSIQKLSSLQQAIKYGDKNAIADAVASYSSHGPYRADGTPVNRSRRLEEANMIRGSSEGGGDPITADYSSKNMELAREKLIREIQAKRATSLAAFTSADLPAPGSPEAAAMVGDAKGAQAVADRIKEQFAHLKNPQCVALAKAYVGATESVTEWRRGTNVMDGTLRPGTPIATFMDKDGNPSDRYDAGGKGRPGNFTTHAAVFLDYVRVGGKITGIRVMEQYATSGGAKERVYPVGGFGTSNAANYHAINNAQGAPLGHNNPMLQSQQVAATVQASQERKTPPVPKAGPQGDPSVESKRNPAVIPQDNKASEKKAEEKKPEVKPEEKKPVETKPPIPTPANPAPQVRNPEVRKNAYGGDNRVNTDQIKGYNLGGDGENVLVTNKNQKPLFTMNTNESITMNPLNDTATVTPKNKNNTIKSNSDNPMQGRLNDMQDSIKELSSRFETNKTMPQPQERHDPHPPEGGAWLNNLNKLTEHVFHSPATKRAFYRAQGQEADNGTGTNHYSHGNRS